MIPTLNTYLERLEIQPQTPNLELVKMLQTRHLAAFSFNSVAVLLKRTISLNLEDILEKIVVQNFGGYCFEHNKLMCEALKFLGFKTRILVGRVINNQAIDSPRTHRLTLLYWEDEAYLVDVGFGPKGLRAPIKIEEGAQSIEAGLEYRLVVNQDQDYQLELRTDSGYFSLYTFNLSRYTEADCLMGHFYSCQYPGATFVNNLVVSRILSGETRSLRNRSFHRISPQATEVVEIVSPSQLRDQLKEEFGIEVTEAEAQVLYQQAERNG